MWKSMFAVAAMLCVGCVADAGDDDEEVADNADALSAEAAIGGHAFGLGVDAPKAIVSPLWPKLVGSWRQGDAHLSTARTVFYVDGFDTTALRVWVDGVKHGGLKPVVAVSVLRHDAAGKHIAPVDRATYRARFQQLLHAFPDVAYWGAINEPDLELTGTGSERAKEAAVYYADAYKVLRRCQNAGKCSGSVLLVAGEFSYQGGAPANSVRFWEEYADAMHDQVKPKGPIHRFPRIWALHPYTDTISGKTEGTDRFDAFLGRVEKSEKLANRHLRAWLTETGGILHHGDTCSSSAGNINGSPQKQLTGAKAVYAMQKDNRVDRVYWWHWQQIPGHPWDSAMVDAAGTPRGAFCALTKQPVSACPGDSSATQCK